MLGYCADCGYRADVETNYSDVGKRLWCPKHFLHFAAIRYAFRELKYSPDQAMQFGQDRMNDLLIQLEEERKGRDGKNSG